MIFHARQTVMAGGFLATNYDKKAMLSKLDGVMKNLFHDPIDAFYTGRVMDLLFDGVAIDCSSTDTFTSAACMTLEGQVPVQRVDEDHLSFSVLGGVRSIFILSIIHFLFFK